MQAKVGGCSRGGSHFDGRGDRSGWRRQNSVVPSPAQLGYAPAVAQAGDLPHSQRLQPLQQPAPLLLILLQHLLIYLFLTFHRPYNPNPPGLHEVIHPLLQDNGSSQPRRFLTFQQFIRYFSYHECWNRASWSCSGC